MNKNAITEFCNYFHLPGEKIFELIHDPSKRKYQIYLIPKKKIGEFRLIESPCDELKYVQRRILFVLNTNFDKRLEKNIHGFRKAKSSLTNAQFHPIKRSQYIVRFDIKDFFLSISYYRVKSLAVKLFKFSPAAANVFALLVTNNKHLPQGSPCSPIISNLIAFKMDHLLMTVAKKGKAKYSRYADDIIFSFQRKEYLNIFVKQSSGKYVPSDSISQIFHDNKFAINESKTVVKSKNSSQRITGIVINEKYNLPHEFINKTRALIHNAKQNKKPADQSLIGRVNYIRQILSKESGYAIKYSYELNKLGVSYFPDADFTVDQNYATKKYIAQIVTDESFPGTCFFYKNFIITSKHVLESKGKKDYLYPIFILSYFEDNEVKSEIIEVQKAVIYNEILLIKPKEIKLKTKNRQLRICENLIKANQVVKSIGYLEKIDDINPIYVSESHVIRSTTRNKTKMGQVEPGKIIKGMSGGPTINENYEVVGVNFSGDAIDLDDRITHSDNLFSFLNLETAKRMIHKLLTDKSNEIFLK